MKRILLIIALAVSYTALSQYTCTDPTACNYDSTATVNWQQFCEYPTEQIDCNGNAIPPYGCTDSAACNYDATATINLPSYCEYPSSSYVDCNGNYLQGYGCTDENACSYDPSATTNLEHLCIYPEPGYFDCEGNVEAINTYPCYPACDCQGTYFDWDFDGDCDQFDANKPALFDTWSAPVSASGELCSPIDLVFTFDFSSSLDPFNTPDTVNISYTYGDSLIDYFYPWIIDGSVRIGLISFSDQISDVRASLLFDINENFTGHLYWKMLKGLLYNWEHLSSYATSSNVAPGLARAYDNLTHQFKIKPENEKNIFIVSDGAWPDMSNSSKANAVEEFANSIKSGSYDVQDPFEDNLNIVYSNLYLGNWSTPYVQTNILGAALITDDYGPEVLNSALDNYLLLCNSENHVFSNKPEDQLIQQVHSYYQNNLVNCQEFTCQSEIDFNNYTYPIIQIDDRCWFAEDLRYDVLNSTTDPELWAAGNEAPMQTYEPTLSSDVYNYNWYAVNQLDLCPTGWHVSDNSDWNNLEATLFGAKPHKLTRQSRTEEYDLNALVSNQFITEPFTVGLRENEAGLWRENETSIYWWTAEEYTRKPLEFNRQKAAWARGINGSSYVISRALWSTSNNKNNALRVRCVKDIN